MFYIQKSLFKLILLSFILLFVFQIIFKSYRIQIEFPYENKLKGCIIVLLTNKKLNELKNLIKNIDSTFNKKYQYPIILFNNEEFTISFKSDIVKQTNSTIEFGLIPKEYWDVPDWINRTKLNESIHKIGKSEGYRQMCRFYAGFFFRHELTLKYDYYMRLDTDSAFGCELDEDPFRHLKLNKLKYSFILSSHEGRFTIPTLWDTIKQWTNKSSIKMNKNGLEFITDDDGKSLNGQTCIFYNNFEMAEFSVFRNEKYLNYFNFLDKTGGFFYERWVKKI